MNIADLAARARAVGRPAVQVWHDVDGAWVALVAFPSSGGAVTWRETCEEATLAAEGIVREWEVGNA